MKLEFESGSSYNVTEGNEGQKVYTAEFWNDSEKLLGTYMEDEHYDLLVEDDADFFAPTDFGAENSEANVMFIYRRGVFTEEEQLGAYDALVEAATETQNRGTAAGPKGDMLSASGRGGREWVTPFQAEVLEWLGRPLSALVDDENIDTIRARHENSKAGSEEPRGVVWMRSEVTKEYPEYYGWFDKWLETVLPLSREEQIKETERVTSKFISETNYAQSVMSGIAGFFDRYPRIPYGRATSFTEKNYDKYEGCYPFMRKLAKKFEELLPNRHKAQVAQANRLDEQFRVAGRETPFTTITVNKNFRTAAHRDAGDLTEGFSNLSVIAKDKEWKGGYLVLPEFRVAINIRPGDLLLINNHEGIHGNTPLLPPEGKDIEDMERISLVCYFREKMTELGSWEYEQTRKQFVDDRRKNPDHPLQRRLWNGVSPGMWDTQEWFDYLRENGGEQMLEYYHPEAADDGGSLEDFFG